MLPGFKHADDALWASWHYHDDTPANGADGNRECNLVTMFVSLSNRCHTNPGLSARKLSRNGSGEVGRIGNESRLVRTEVRSWAS